MAFSRAQIKTILKTAGVSDDVIKDAVDELIELHTETVNGFKGEKATLLESVEQLKADLNAAKDGGEWKAKYEALETEYNGYKDNINAAETYKAKEAAYRSLLAESGVSDKRIDGVVKYDKSVIDAIEIDEKGAVKGADKIKTTIADNWKDFIVEHGTKGADVSKPPANNGGVTPEAFAKMGYNERIKLYNENPDAYRSLSATERK